jgi:hypothetical protein
MGTGISISKKPASSTSGASRHRSTGTLGAASLLLGATGASIALSSIAAADDKDLAGKAAEGLKSYQVFRQNDAKINHGNDIANNLSGTDIGITVIKQEDLKGQSPADIAQAVLDKTDGTYDTIGVAVVGSNGHKDQLFFASKHDGFVSDIHSLLGNEVDDVGQTLYEGSGRILRTYSAHGGDVSGDSNDVLEKADKSASKLVEKAASSTKDQHVYQADGANIGDLSQTLKNLKDTGVTVTVLPTDKMEGIGVQDAAKQIVEENESILDDNSAVSVVVYHKNGGVDQIGVYSRSDELQKNVKNALDATTTQNSNALLNDKSDDVAQVWNKWHTEQEHSDKEFMNFVGSAFAGLVGLVVLFAVGSFAYGVVSKVIEGHKEKIEAKKKAEKQAREEAERLKMEQAAEEARLAAEVKKRGGRSQEVYEEMQTLEDNRKKISKGRRSKSTRQQFSNILSELQKNILTLYEVANKSEEGWEPLNTSLGMQIHELNNSVGPNHLQSILDNPELWTEPDEKISLSLKAAEALNRIVLNRITNLNEASSFDPSVSAMTLIEMADELEGTAGLDDDDAEIMEFAMSEGEN